MEKDWGQNSNIFDEIFAYAKQNEILKKNEAQTRFHIIDRIIKELLGWKDEFIEVEERIDTILGLTGPNAIDAITKKKLKFLVMLWRRKLIKNVEISEYQISQLEILAR